MRDLINPRQVILVTSEAEMELFGKKAEKQNIVTIAWHMPVSFEPMIYAIAVSKARLSHRMISKSKVFCVNFISKSLEKKALFCGRNSGEHIDKFKESGLTKEDCDSIHCPRIKEALAFLECEVAEEVEVGDHIIFIGKVVNSRLKKSEKRLFYLGDDKFTTTT